jgi:YD repeat-containing protein
MASFGLTGGGGANYYYTYNAAGRVTSQRLYASPAGWYWPPLDVTTNYTWDNEGKLTQMNYPGVVNPYPYQYQYDQLGRLNGMTGYDPNTSQWVPLASSSHGVAGEVTSLWTTWAGTETRTYNSLLQLTQASVPGAMDMRYVYANGQNNGRITESIDGISGEDVQYTYDSLQRLVLAQTTNTGPQWGDAYTYDGFGNLTAKTVTKGYAPALAAVYDLATNRPVNGNYDANGNAPMGTWGVENRLLSQTLDGQTISQM